MVNETLFFYFSANIIVLLYWTKYFSFISIKQISLFLIFLLVYTYIFVVYFSELGHLVFIMSVFSIETILIVKYTHKWLISVVLINVQICLLMIIWEATFLITRFFVGLLSFENLKLSLLVFVIQNALLLIIPKIIISKVKISYIKDFLNEHHKEYRLFSIILFFQYISLQVMYAEVLKINSRYFELALMGVAVLMNIGSITFISYQTKLKNSQKIVDTLSYYYQSEKNKTELSAEFRHDLKSLLIGLQILLEEDSYVEAKELVYQMVEQSKPFLSENVHDRLCIINNLAIQGLLLDFYHRCEEKNTFLNMNLENVPSEIVNKQLANILRSVSILLENSLEETTLLNDVEKTIYLEVKSEEDWVVFKVKNKTNNEAKVSDFLKRGFSTKESNTGLGLYNIKKIEERNKNTHLNLKKSKNFFTAILTITSK